VLSPVLFNIHTDSFYNVYNHLILVVALDHVISAVSYMRMIIITLSASSLCELQRMIDICLDKAAN